MNKSPLPFPSLSKLFAPALSMAVMLSGCEKVPPTAVTPKPVGICIEVQVFRLPRGLASKVVLNQPPKTDSAELLKAVQALVADKQATLVAAPVVSTLSGNRAVIESILEHRYPIEYEQPQIPQTFGNTATKVTKSTTITEETITFPNTPTTPTTFETRNMGSTLEVEPVVSADKSEITLQIAVQNVALHGMVKFKTENNGEIEQPDFYTKKLNTNVVVKDGGVVLLGTVDPDKVLATDEDLTEAVFLRAMVR